MLAITLALLVCQHMSTSWSTRLPLEVYELTPAAPATATDGSGSSSSSNSRTHELNYLKHKSLEYATVNAKSLTSSAANAADSASAPPHSPPNANEQQLDHRRSRQMLDIIQQQHRFSHDGQQLQKLHQQQLGNKQPSHASSGSGHAKDVRILYQVGESEDDLPICAPNAVCSKIDLYETPWIERQCRCPDANRMSIVIIHHHHDQHNGNNKEAAVAPQHNPHSEKYRSYYEKEKMLQHKRLLVGDFNDKKFDSLHLKKLMQKLGAVYEDDLHLQPSDYVEQENINDAVPMSVEDLDEISDNEFPQGPRRHAYEVQHMNTAHMRHSGHMGHRAKEASFIGGCPSGLGIEDGHTIADKTRHYKLCQPVHKLPVCKHFRDYTWTLTTSSELNVTEQIVHCRCPKNSVTYLTKREPAADGTSGYTYLFACSPLTRIRCQRKQPCKLFTVRKRQEFLDEVNINALCQCPKGHHCPSHHTQSGVISGESFLEDNIQTYSGYCMAND